MKPWVKGLVIAAVQVGLVASLGAKLLYDRAVQPRVWVLSTPYDPNLPIRGRYVSLQLVVEPKGIEKKDPRPAWQQRYAVILRVEEGRLLAEADPREHDGSPSALHVRWLLRDGKELPVLDQPAAFFIPEHVPDPSRRPPGEELWVEVTIPKKGPPRPIRLGVKSGGGPIVPLQLG
jgi:hypothetical protein